MLISEFKIGKKLYTFMDVTQPTLNYQAHAVSQLDNIINDKEIVILAPIYKGTEVAIPIGHKIKVVFVHEGGLFEFEALNQQNILENNITFYKLTIIDEIKKIQRRSFFRVTAEIPVTYKTISQIRSVNNVGLTKDISGGGVRFICKDRFNEGDVIFITLKINNESSISSLFEIIRSELVSAGTFETSGKFRNIDSKYREIIIRNLFEIQRENMKK